MILLGILFTITALAWPWRWLVRHEADVRHRWAGFAAHPRVTALRTRFAPRVAFLQARLSPAGFLGLDLTIGAMILIGASWIFGKIAEDVVTGDPLTVVDKEIALWLHLHATPTLTEAMKFLSLMASVPLVTGICLFIALYLVRKRYRYRLLALMLAIPVGIWKKPSPGRPCRPGDGPLAVKNVQVIAISPAPESQPSCFRTCLHPLHWSLRAWIPRTPLS